MEITQVQATVLEYPKLFLQGTTVLLASANDILASTSTVCAAVGSARGSAWGPN